MAASRSGVGQAGGPSGESILISKTMLLLRSGKFGRYAGASTRGQNSLGPEFKLMALRSVTLGPLLVNAADSTSNDAESVPDSDPSLAAQGELTAGPQGDVSWSQTISQRFSLDLSPDLVAWWDDEVWRHLGPGEYCHPATPKVLLGDAPDPVWPPLMPPNFLPLVGNGAGDWLCLRILDPDVAEATGRTTDVCHWYHGGGDWLPWGNTLAEALLFDWALPRLPQSERRHADPAEASSVQNEEGIDAIEQHDHPWVMWAKSHLPSVGKSDEVADDVSVLAELGQLSGRDLAERLIERGICEIPARCQLLLDGLHHELVEKLTPAIANKLDLTWNELMRWCFDLGTLPREVASRIQAELGLPESATQVCQQDWETVQQHASVISAQARDLSWGHDILGYCLQRAGRTDEAASAFAKAIRCSVFTDQSVRLRTHWATSSDGVSKVSARFLDKDAAVDASSTAAIPDQLGCVPAAIEQPVLIKLLCSRSAAGPDSMRQEYAETLIARSRDFQTTAPATEARLLYSAGWDLGAEPLRCFGDLLDQYISACREAGWVSHQRLAEVHRQGLQTRYRL